MGYWKDYNDGQSGNPLGNPWSSGYIQGEQDRRRQEWQQYNNNNGGGDNGKGCAYIILFIFAIPILLMVLPITIPAVFSALFMAIILNVFSKQTLSTAASPSFGKVFKWLFYTYLWYIPISILIGFASSIAMVALGLGLENKNIMDFLNTELADIEYDSLAICKLSFMTFIFQIPNFLIAGAIFRRYLIKGSVSEVSYWRATILISFSLMTWFAITGIEFFLLANFSPEIFNNLVIKYQYFLS